MMCFSPTRLIPLLTVSFLCIGIQAETYAQQQNNEAKIIEASASQATSETTTAAKTDLLSGKWCGYWVSCKNGHNGKLKATFCRLNECQVQAVFVGSFAKILPFRYKAVLQVVHEEDGMIHLRGSQRLGPIMGTFTYEATITADSFRATYRSKRDCGQWNMERVACCQ